MLYRCIYFYVINKYHDFIQQCKIVFIIIIFLYISGCYNKFYEEGMYCCVVCRQDLFTSKTKYDSGCGWPAFNDVLSKEKVTLHQDTSAGMCSYINKHPVSVFVWLWLMHGKIIIVFNNLKTIWGVCLMSNSITNWIKIFVTYFLRFFIQ